MTWHVTREIRAEDDKEKGTPEVKNRHVSPSLGDWAKCGNPYDMATKHSTRVKAPAWP